MSCLLFKLRSSLWLKGHGKKTRSAYPPYIPFKRSGGCETAQFLDIALDPKAIWRNVQERDNFPADWCILYNQLGIGEPFLPKASLKGTRSSSRDSCIEAETPSKCPRTTQSPRQLLSTSLLDPRPSSQASLFGDEDSVDLAPLIDQQFGNCYRAAVNEPSKVLTAVRDALVAKSRTVAPISEVTSENILSEFFDQDPGEGTSAQPQQEVFPPPSLPSGPSYWTISNLPQDFLPHSSGFQFNIPQVETNVLPDGRFSAPPTVGCRPPPLYVNPSEDTSLRDWFVPPLTVLIDFQTNSCILDLEDGSVKDFSSQVWLKEEGHKRLFQPKVGIP